MKTPTVVLDNVDLTLLRAQLTGVSNALAMLRGTGDVLSSAASDAVPEALEGVLALLGEIHDQLAPPKRGKR